MVYAMAVWTIQTLQYQREKREEEGREILGNITENFPHCTYMYVSQNVACGLETSFCKVLNRKCFMYMCTCSLHSVSRETNIYVHTMFTH